MKAYLYSKEKENPEEIKEIYDLACIPHEDHFLPPGQLAFIGNKGNYWGNWKYRLSSKGLSAEDQTVYKQVGVLSSIPDSDSSLKFFQWLNDQNEASVIYHLGSIFRHIQYPSGPISWWNDYPDVRFIPVYVGEKNIDIISGSDATDLDSMVFLPDFSDLVQVIQSDPSANSILIAIDELSINDIPISGHLKRIGIKSLRDYIGEPINIVGEKSLVETEHLLEKLNHIRSEKILREFKKRLAELDINDSVCKLRSHWKDRLSKIRYIRLSLSLLSVTYKFKGLRGRYFKVSVLSGYDEGTSTLWISESEGNIDNLFYSVISDLIFENPPKYVSLSLPQVIERDFIDNSIVIPKEMYDTEEEEDDIPADNKSLGEVSETHGPLIIDPKKNLPKMKPITEESDLINFPLRKKTKEESLSRRGSQQRIASKVERINIEELKSDQYAGHCQICLAEKTPEELAPAGSYVEFYEFRRKLIDAHHLDQIHAGGARHAGNILLMCQKHHNLLGDKLSRRVITEVLKGEIKSKVIEFKSEDDTVLIEGRVIKIKVQSISEDLRCFITHAHAEIWLNNLDES